MAFKKILVAIDFTPITKKVIENAMELAKCNNAEVDLVYVVEPYEYPIVATVDGILVPPDDLTVLEDVNERLREEAEIHLKKFAELLEKEGIKVTTHIIEGEPFEEILDFSEKNKSDLIVVGAHGKSGLKRLLIGSVSEKVVRKAKIPVLVVRGIYEEQRNS